MTSSRVCLGVVVGAHGIRGAVKVKCFTADPEDFGAYGPVEDEAGGPKRKVRVVGVSKGLALVTLDGIASRDDAEALKGVRFTVDRARLPKADEDEFLVADLVGLKVVSPDGLDMGVVRNVFDFGAGEVIEIAGGPEVVMVPFTRQAVPEVDIAGGRLVVVPPVYAEVEPGERAATEGQDDGARSATGALSAPERKRRSQGSASDRPAPEGQEE